jgi:hypothetical protein
MAMRIKIIEAITGAAHWWKGTNGAAHVYGLSRNQEKVTSVSTQTIYGYKIIEAGSSGNWTFSPSGGGSDYTLTSAEAAVLEGVVCPEELDSITPATAGVVILYIGDA